MPSPVHPGSVAMQGFHGTHDDNEQERCYGYSRHGLFDDLGHEEGQASGALPPPAPSPRQGRQNDNQAGLGAGLETASSLGHMDGNIQGGSSMSNLPLPTIAGAQVEGAQFHSVSPFGTSGGYGAPGFSAIGPGDVMDGITNEGKTMGFQHKMRPMTRSRAQQMTESQRKQRHNEHTRASRSRIDRGLDRLKAVIKKVRPEQKVSKKADVLHEAVKLLKEGFHLPRTESDDERDEPQESSLSV